MGDFPGSLVTDSSLPEREGGEVGGGESAPLFGPVFLFLEGRHEIHLLKATLVHG